MKFSEIANRLTGISTPFGGASWQPAEMEIAAARRVIAFLEDRAGGPVIRRKEHPFTMRSCAPFIGGWPGHPS